MDERVEPCGMPVLTANHPVAFRFIARVVLRSFKKLFNQSVIHFGIFLYVDCALVFDVKRVTVQPGCGIDYLLGSYALENIKDAERKQAKGALSRNLYR